MISMVMGMFALNIVKNGERGSIGRLLKDDVAVNNISISFTFAGGMTRHHPILTAAPIEV